MKTSEATELQLDLLVAKCEGRNDVYYAESIKQMVWEGTYPMDDTELGYVLYQYLPSTDWAQGGPIIECEGICLHKYKDGSGWSATYSAQDPEQYGPTPLIAAMRCYVASKLGDEVEIPKELT
jgi:hypothetical protein